MISALIREFVIPLLIFLFLRSVLRSLFSGRRRPPQRSSQAPPQPPVSRLLHRDPVCGVYVAEDASVTGTIGGQTVYFCSTGCRDRYRPA